MASRKEHCDDCRKALGEDFDFIHSWLDRHAIEVRKDGSVWLDRNHRKYDHHREGIEDIRKKWGDQAAEAARIHIKRDEGKIRGRKEMFYDYQGKDYMRLKT